MSSIEIYDTTLRDGAQGVGINFSVSDKLRIAEHLDRIGVSVIASAASMNARRACV